MSDSLLELTTALDSHLHLPARASPVKPHVLTGLAGPTPLEQKIDRKGAGSRFCFIQNGFWQTSGLKMKLIVISSASLSGEDQELPPDSGQTGHGSTAGCACAHGHAK